MLPIRTHLVSSSPLPFPRDIEASCSLTLNNRLAVERGTGKAMTIDTRMILHRAGFERRSRPGLGQS